MEKKIQFKALTQICDLSSSSSVVSVEEAYLAVLYPHLWKILLTASAKTKSDKQIDGQTDGQTHGQTLPWSSLSLSVKET